MTENRLNLIYSRTHNGHKFIDPNSSNSLRSNIQKFCIFYFSLATVRLQTFLITTTDRPCTRQSADSPICASVVMLLTNIRKRRQQTSFTHHHALSLFFCLAFSASLRLHVTPTLHTERWKTARRTNIAKCTRTETLCVVPNQGVTYSDHQPQQTGITPFACRTANKG